MEKCEKEGPSACPAEDAKSGEPSGVEARANDRCPYCGFRSGSPHELLVHIFQCHPG